MQTSLNCLKRSRRRAHRKCWRSSTQRETRPTIASCLRSSRERWTRRTSSSTAMKKRCFISARKRKSNGVPKLGSIRSLSKTVWQTQMKMVTSLAVMEGTHSPDKRVLSRIVSTRSCRIRMMRLKRAFCRTSANSKLKGSTPWIKAKNEYYVSTMFNFKFQGLS